MIRAIHDQLQMLERGPLHTGGFPKPSVKHWIVSPVGENAGGVSRPEGETVEAYQVKPHEIQRICNEQQFSNGNRHYLGVQFVLWDGQLVLTMLITVTVLHHTLRIEVTGHALGPVHGLFSGGPAARQRTTAKPIKFWETKTHKLPLVDATEVVRLLVRAPLTPYPAVLDHLGGKMSLPSPSGCATSGPGGRGPTASWPTTRCARRRRCCGWCTRRRCGSWRRTAWTPAASRAARRD